MELFSFYKILINTTKKVKLPPYHAMEAMKGCEMLRIPHCLDSSQMTVRLSALCTGHALLPRNIFLFLELVSVRGSANPRTESIR
jgi:hypothetical protein